MAKKKREEPPPPARQEATSDRWEAAVSGGRWRPAAEVMRTVSAVRSPCWDWNYATMVGGIPQGRILVFYGESGEGKSALLYIKLRAIMEAGGMAGLLTSEAAEDPEYVRRMVGPYYGSHRFRMPPYPETLEAMADYVTEFFEMARAARDADPSFPGAVVGLDSIDGFVPKEILDEISQRVRSGTEEAEVVSGRRRGRKKTRTQIIANMTAGNYDQRRAGKLRPLVTAWVPMCQNANTTLVAITHQTADKVDSWGNVTAHKHRGGKALKYYSSQMWQVERDGFVHDGSGKDAEVVGERLVVTLHKNKVGRLEDGDRAEAYVHLRNPPIGLDEERDLLACAMRRGAVDVRGSNVYVDGQRVGNSADAALAALRADRSLYDRMLAAVAAHEERTRPARRLGAEP